jgi:hypothetical protein
LSNCAIRRSSWTKNGRLLEAAEAAGFDVLITVDQNIPDQQNLAGRAISLLILCENNSPLRRRDAEKNKVKVRTGGR